MALYLGNDEVSQKIVLKQKDNITEGNIGDVRYTLSTVIPAGGAWCDGALYTKAKFPDVYQMLIEGKLQSIAISNFDACVTTNGACGFFGLDTDNESFKVPLLKDVYIKAGDNPIMFGAESLPNITGNFEGRGLLDQDVAKIKTEGAFSLLQSQNVNTAQAYTSSNTSQGFAFDASLSSPIYQDNVKVNPDYVSYKAYIVLYTSATEVSVAQTAEFMQGLSEKANISLDNVLSNIDYVVESYVNETDWYRLYKSGWCEQGGYISNSVSEDIEVTFIKPYTSVKNISISGVATKSGTQNAVLGKEQTGFYDLTNNGFKKFMYTPAYEGYYWQASGMTI